MSECNDWIGGVIVGIGTRQKADLGDYLVFFSGEDQSVRSKLALWVLQDDLLRLLALAYVRNTMSRVTVSRKLQSSFFFH